MIVMSFIVICYYKLIMWWKMILNVIIFFSKR